MGDHGQRRCCGAPGRVVVRDAVGNILAYGDPVTFINNLNVKGAGQIHERGTLI